MESDRFSGFDVGVASSVGGAAASFVLSLLGCKPAGDNGRGAPDDVPEGWDEDEDVVVDEADDDVKGDLSERTVPS